MAGSSPSPLEKSGCAVKGPSLDRWKTGMAARRFRAGMPRGKRINAVFRDWLIFVSFFPRLSGDDADSCSADLLS